jgi:hypothetical protein
MQFMPCLWKIYRQKSVNAWDIQKAFWMFFPTKVVRKNETPFYNDMMQETLLQLSERALQSAKAEISNPSD